VNSLRPAKIIQALALFEEKNSAEYGLALWAAFHEVERFYRTAGAVVEYRRFYIAPSPPSPSFLQSITHALDKWIPGGELQSALELLRQNEVRSSAAPSAELSPDSRRRTYDQTRLGAIIRKMVDPQLSGDHLMIVTDRPITPPPKWRYIIWENDPNTNTSVISTAPLDPDYWRDRDPHRVLTVKTRTRNAALSITGELIGLERCENPSCFLFDDVDSVTVLDEMQELGKEHGITKLVGYGFDDVVNDPTLVQPATTQPRRTR
jgi:predicted Zn-dependent protease